MIPYWVLFGLCAIGAILARPRDQNRQRHPFLWLAGAGIALMVGLRFEVGADWENYLRIFGLFDHLSWEVAINRSDPGFYLLNWWAADNGWKIWVVNLVCAALFSWGLIRFCLSQPFPWIALTVAIPYIVIVVAMGYTRQGAALGIILAGLADYLRRESILRLAAYIALAATFHSTAVLAFILVALTGRRNRAVTFIGAIAVSILFYNLFLASSVDRFYGVYLKTGYSSQGALIRIMMDVSAAILFLAVGRRLAFDEVEYKIWRNFALVSIAALIALAISPSSTAVDRVAIYLLPIQIAVFNRLPLLARRNELVRFVPVLLFGAVLFVWLNFAQHAKLWVPYQYFTL
jgi:hypothetical protein